MGRANSDESYVLDLCDELLGVPSERQRRFDFLLGDPGKSGRRVRLPIDAYYPSAALAIEYREVQHTKAVQHFDKPTVLTVSGVHRGEQRRIYDQRRRDVLPANGIRLVEIGYSGLSADGRGKLRRDRVRDLAAISALLEGAGSTLPKRAPT